ncbi:Uncharacterized protein dnm_057580 [Desulfonema magnum]|uniref:Uncharacterized protein n=1 Tax=Desulfonema magnum TaxID=45655 RepID=A0A975BQ92_9BACT|nr:Uncharacterized protein dnm_057580 [Desulfonema magnum]
MLYAAQGLFVVSDSCGLKKNRQLCLYDKPPERNITNFYDLLIPSRKNL